MQEDVINMIRCHLRVRRLLTGTYLVMVCAFEATALFNPSIVESPDQDGPPQGGTRAGCC